VQLEHLPDNVPKKEAHVTETSNPHRIEGFSRRGVSPSREWISYTEATELVGLGRTTLWKLAGAGEIEVARVGRARRISRESLTAYMKRSAGDSAVGSE
jgi:excisionase family DNA binding protein